MGRTRRYFPAIIPINPIAAWKQLWLPDPDHLNALALKEREQLGGYSKSYHRCRGSTGSSSSRYWHGVTLPCLSSPPHPRCSLCQGLLAQGLFPPTLYRQRSPFIRQKSFLDTYGQNPVQRVWISRESGPTI